jgi:broad specificity phosphatase PhoE
MLSDRGKKQTERVAQALSHTDIGAIYSSPLIRALHTAEEIARPHQLCITPVPDLREMAFGALEGKAVTDIGGDFMRYLMKWHIDGGTERVPGGESLAEMADRAWAAAQQIISCDAHQTIVLVSHYFVTLAIVCKALDIPLQHLERLRVGAASISTLNINDGYATLLSLGETRHLDGV